MTKCRNHLESSFCAKFSEILRGLTFSFFRNRLHKCDAFKLYQMYCVTLGGKRLAQLHW